jgi:uncharacterized protein
MGPTNNRRVPQLTDIVADALHPTLLHSHAAAATLAADNIWASNLLSPPILFFVLGLVAAAVRSDLKIPATFGKVMSLYLLFAIGFKGGVMLHDSGATQQGMLAILAAALLSAFTPLWLFPILRKKLGVATAAGVAATYGSVSAVTFIAATAMLRERNVEFGGYMVAAMVIMEFPALIVGVVTARLCDPSLSTASNANAHAKASEDPDDDTPAPHQLATSSPAAQRHSGLLGALRESVTNGSVVILLGSMIIGIVTTDKGREITAPLWSDLFFGLLCFYLLDLGLTAGRGFKDVVKGGRIVFLTALLFPPVNAAVGLGLSMLFGLRQGDAFVMMAMAASASYIAAPAALGIALPQARASVYVPMALTVTFPFNIIIGLPLYWIVASNVT